TLVDLNAAWVSRSSEVTAPVSVSRWAVSMRSHQHPVYALLEGLARSAGALLPITLPPDDRPTQSQVATPALPVDLRAPCLRSIRRQSACREQRGGPPAGGRAVGELAVRWRYVGNDSAACTLQVLLTVMLDFGPAPLAAHRDATSLDWPIAGRRVRWGEKGGMGGMGDERIGCVRPNNAHLGTQCVLCLPLKSNQHGEPGLSLERWCMVRPGQQWQRSL